MDVITAVGARQVGVYLFIVGPGGRAKIHGTEAPPELLIAPRQLLPNHGRDPFFRRLAGNSSNLRQRLAKIVR